MPWLRVPGGRLRLDALVLDKDGVLQDFEASWLPVVLARARATARALGQVDLAPRLCRAMGLTEAHQVDPQGILAMGNALEAQGAAAYEAHRLGFGWAQARRAAAQGFAEAKAACPLQPKAIPGAVEAAKRLHALGFRLAMCTSDDLAGAQDFLEAHGLSDQIPVVVAADGRVPGKPHPAALWRAVEALKLSCTRVAMVGDTPSDLRMARTAGAALGVGLCSGVSSPELLRPWADWLLPDLAHLAEAAA